VRNRVRVCTLGIAEGHAQADASDASHEQRHGPRSPRRSRTPSSSLGLVPCWLGYQGARFSLPRPRLARAKVGVQRECDAQSDADADADAHSHAKSV
jgi:hypothetical protein